VLTIDQNLVNDLVAIIKQANQAILTVYQQDKPLAIAHKADQSPVTQADRKAHAIIARELTKLTPQLPLISEEAELPSVAIRQQWRQYWLVDPLDGTKEFIATNGQFTTNIALIQDQQAVLGIVGVPVSGKIYLGGPHWPAVKLAADQWQPIKTRKTRQQILDVITSQRHQGEQMATCLTLLKQHFSQVKLCTAGSSLKICRLAEGLADFYPRLAPTCQWDTAAAHAVLSGAGGQLLDKDFNQLTYPVTAKLVNPDFYAIADPKFNWQALLNSLK
jgi:3'(2'), 5'-bisphosphate nucleotidase